MLFLNVTDKLLEYFHTFEKILNNKGLNWQKYDYIKKIFEYRENYKNIEETVIIELFENIYRNT